MAKKRSPFEVTLNIHNWEKRANHGPGMCWSFRYETTEVAMSQVRATVPTTASPSKVREVAKREAIFAMTRDSMEASAVLDAIKGRREPDDSLMNHLMNEIEPWWMMIWHAFCPCKNHTVSGRLTRQCIRSICVGTLISLGGGMES